MPGPWSAKNNQYKNSITEEIFTSDLMYRTNTPSREMVDWRPTEVFPHDMEEEVDGGQWTFALTPRPPVSKRLENRRERFRHDMVTSSRGNTTEAVEK